MVIARRKGHRKSLARAAAPADADGGREPGRFSARRKTETILRMLRGEALDSLAMGLVFYSPAATQKYTLEDRRSGKPEAVVGCGPFRLVEWVKGKHLVMDRFDKYWDPGFPYLDRVVIRVIKDPITQMAAFKAGEVDFIVDFSPEHVETLRAQNPRAVIMTGKETTPMVAMMKVTVPRDAKPMSKDRAPHPIFGDIWVRKAIGCYGIDRKEIVKIAFKGQATPWLGIIPPGTPDTVDWPPSWNTISGSPFYEVAQPWMKDYVYQAEWKVLYKKVWLDK